MQCISMHQDGGDCTLSILDSRTVNVASDWINTSIKKRHTYEEFSSDEWRLDV